MRIDSTIKLTGALVFVCLTTAAAPAQVPGGLGRSLGRGGGAGNPGAANVERVQAQVRQRVQGQVQQRVQARVQARAQVQAQARARAQAARAADVAQRAAAAAQNRARAAVGAVPRSAEVGISGNASVQSRGRGPGQSAGFRSAANANAQAGFSIPPGVTQADVAIYDDIFGKFNPLRQRSRHGETGASDSPRSSTPLTSRAGVPTTPPAQQAREQMLDGAASADLDFATRVQIAAHQRRAEIAELRDQAIATGQAELMSRADAMEQRLDDFAAAQAEAQARAQANAHTALDAATQRATEAAAGVTETASGMIEAAGSAAARTAARPGASASGSASGSATLQQ